MNKTSCRGEALAQRAGPSSEGRYRKLIEQLQAIVWEAQPDNWRFTLVSPYAQALLGYPLEQWYRADFWLEHLHADDRERVLACCSEAIAQGRDHELEYRMLAVDGRVVWLRDVIRVELCQGEPTKLSGIMFDITERKAAEEDLLRKSDEAEESSRLKTEFLANMSHEIRTPMNGIIGFVELLAMEDLSDQQAEWVNIVRNCGQELLGLIDDILDISRIEANQLRVDPCQFAVADVLGDVRQTNASVIEAKGLSFSIECAGDTPQSMNSDPQRLRQILNNLLTNALKFTDSGGISVRTRGDSL
ncbi:MAG: PAS domain-containing protein, partial [Phycisphaerae bacterium]|nr:PAS domain-containing protein [Phycisphaerae bacterium]